LRAGYAFLLPATATTRHPAVSNDVKHRERFAVRSRYMTLEPVLNKYVEYFDNIRIIQKALAKRADYYLIPKIDNTNVDRSLATIHTTIVRVLRKSVDVGVRTLCTPELAPIFDRQSGKPLLLSREFARTYQRAWSSKAMRETLAAKKVSLWLALPFFLFAAFLLRTAALALTHLRTVMRSTHSG
jgi:hypothetical protein